MIEGNKGIPSTHIVDSEATGVATGSTFQEPPSSAEAAVGRVKAAVEEAKGRNREAEKLIQESDDLVEELRELVKEFQRKFTQSN